MLIDRASVRRSLVLCGLALIAVAGCAPSLAATSSGKVGCDPSELTIADEHSAWSARTWTATCHGRRYFCSATVAGRYGEDISCAPEVAASH